MPRLREIGARPMAFIRSVQALPGGMLMLPPLAWWLDRRRGRVRPGAAVPR